MNFEMAKNIVAVIAPLIALFIAWRGLSTWNRQLKGTRDSDLSRRILVALYKAEMMIREIRSPLVEIKLPPETSRLDQEAADKAWAKHYEDRWKALSEILAELKAAGLEAKAVWDKNFMEEMQPFFAEISELYSHLNDHIQKRLNQDYDPLYDGKEAWKIVYATSKDDFGKRIKESVEKIDENVRQRLAGGRQLRKTRRRKWALRKNHI